MRLILIFVTCITFGNNVYSQTDTLQKNRFCGIMAEFGFMSNTKSVALQIEDYKKAAPGDALLNQSFSGYEKNYYFVEPQGHQQLPFFGLKAVFDFQRNRKLNSEISIGLRYRNNIVSSLSYQRENTDTLGLFSSLQSSAQFYQITTKRQAYSFAITASQIFLPVGFNFATNRNRIVWFTFGVEVAPGIIFNQRYRSMYYVNTETFFAEPRSMPADKTYFNMNNDQKILSKTIISLEQPGFSIYAAIPITINFRVAKKPKVLKHINLTASFMPGINYDISKYSGALISPFLSANLGVRYSL